MSFLRTSGILFQIFAPLNGEGILMVIFTFRTPMTTGFIYLNFDLRHQNGISIAELQTSLPTKRP